MPSEYHHGVRVIEINDGARPVRTVSAAVIGTVCTGDDADLTTFPGNRPALITDVQAVVGRAGTKSTLARSVDAIAAQTSPLIVAVRVPTATDVLQLDVIALSKVLPRISDPMLTELDVLRMDPADLVKLGTELAGFLVPNSSKVDVCLKPSTT